MRVCRVWPGSPLAPAARTDLQQQTSELFECQMIPPDGLAPGRSYLVPRRFPVLQGWAAHTCLPSVGPAAAQACGTPGSDTPPIRRLRARTAAGPQQSPNSSETSPAPAWGIAWGAAYRAAPALFGLLHLPPTGTGCVCGWRGEGGAVVARGAFT